MRGLVPNKAKPRGAIRTSGAGAFFCSSPASVRGVPDNTFAGASADEFGTKKLDIAVQTQAVIENISDILAVQGAKLSDLVELAAFLVNMNDFGEYNRVYDESITTAHPNDGRWRISCPIRTCLLKSTQPHTFELPDGRRNKR